MKQLLVFWLFLGSITPALSQSRVPKLQARELARERIVHAFCRGTEITSGPTHDEMTRIRQKLQPAMAGDMQHRIYIALVTGNAINAWDKNLGPNQSLVCVPESIVQFMGDAEGELAFIVAHEVGHAVDDACKTPAGRAQLSSPQPPLSSFVLHWLGGQAGADAVRHIAEQRNCEARADAIGFTLFEAAGYNPFDAAGALGRLEMYLGDTSTGLVSRVTAFGSDHPITPDRIQHMRLLLLNERLVKARVGQ
jgi:Zn-dependent protease with chaperone function